MEKWARLAEILLFGGRCRAPQLAQWIFVFSCCPRGIHVPIPTSKLRYCSMCPHVERTEGESE